MNYTPEQLKDLRDAIDAHLQGKPVEKKHNESTDWEPCLHPTWTTEYWLYRPAPKPVTRKWSKPEDVPLNCWLMATGHDLPSLVVGFTRKGIVYAVEGRNQELRWDEVSQINVVHSTDRKTWKPCEVTE